MIITDIHGNAINWSQVEITVIRMKIILKATTCYLTTDPISIFLDKITYNCYIPDQRKKTKLTKINKFTIRECKLLKRRLNGIIKKWKMDKIKKQVLEFIELLQGCINNRRCLYIYQDNLPLKLVV